MVGAHTDQRRLVGAPALGTIKIQSSLKRKKFRYFNLTILKSFYSRSCRFLKIARKKWIFMAKETVVFVFVQCAT